MKAFEYAGPSTIEEAIKSLSGSKSVVALSGGTDLLSRMKDYVTSPDRVVYLKGVKFLVNIAIGARTMRIASGTTLARIAADKMLLTQCPSLVQAALEVGTPQIRNMATVGGNLLQRPRCWYYRSGFGLLGKKDGKSLVREGDNRYHSIFMTDGDALYTNPSSLAVPLIALGARASIVGAKGDRNVPIEALYQVPKGDDDSELTIKPDELLTDITIPRVNGLKNASYEIRQKRAHDWPLVLCSVALEMDGNRVNSARIVLGGVAPIPWRSNSAEAAIIGKVINAESAAAAGAAAVEGAKPLSMNAYKVTLARTVVKRALLTAVGNRTWEEG